MSGFLCLGVCAKQTVWREADCVDCVEGSCGDSEECGEHQCLCAFNEFKLGAACSAYGVGAMCRVVGRVSALLAVPTALPTSLTRSSQHTVQRLQTVNRVRFVTRLHSNFDCPA